MNLASAPSSGVVASILYLLTLFLESRTRETSFWFWRFIYRPSGRYLVGKYVRPLAAPVKRNIRQLMCLQPFPANSQRTLFALFSLISCGTFIGYFLSFDRIYLEGKDLSEAFVWRSIIWLATGCCHLPWQYPADPPTVHRLPIGIHLWVSSWANLQATIIASQTAVGRQLLGPTLATTLYLAGIILGSLSITGLAIACSVYWTRTWYAQEGLEYTLLDLAFLHADDLPEVARQRVAPLLTVLNSWLGQFTMRVALFVRIRREYKTDEFVAVRRILQADNALCAAGAVLIIAVNFGGFAVVHALHRQIKYAFSSSRSRASRNAHLPALLQVSHHWRHRELSKEFECSTSEAVFEHRRRARSRASRGHCLPRSRSDCRRRPDHSRRAVRLVTFTPARTLSCFRNAHRPLVRSAAAHRPRLFPDQLGRATESVATSRATKSRA